LEGERPVFSFGLAGYVAGRMRSPFSTEFGRRELAGEDRAYLVRSGADGVFASRGRAARGVGDGIGKDLGGTGAAERRDYPL
jgi:hypothetical protein